MLHLIAVLMSIFFLQNGWIKEIDYEWCLYVVEKKLSQGCFLICILVCSLISGQFANVLIFAFTLYFLRSRLGGWHAPYNWLCITMSTFITLLMSFKLGPILLNVSPSFMWSINCLLMIVAFLLKPIYPEQLHFGETIIKENNIKKNFLLIYILFAQIFFFLFGVNQVLVFSFLGVLVSVLLVFIEQLKQYGGCLI